MSTSRALPCPDCGRLLHADLEGAADGISFEKCLRRCDACGVGFSNARTGATRIYREPLRNLPLEVRDGADDALRRALNEVNRRPKRWKLGFSTSEDAVTWAVFSYLVTAAPDALRVVAGKLLGCPPPARVTTLVWGVPVPPGTAGDQLRNALVESLANGLNENPRRLSEPDVVLDCGAAGLLVVEVKLGAKNDQSKPEDESRFDRYLAGTQAFRDGSQVRSTRLYQLARNWRIGWDLAGERPFALVNLGPESLTRRTSTLPAFVSALATSPSRQFRSVTWGALLGWLRDERALPPWLATWLAEPERDLRPTGPAAGVEVHA